MQDQHIVNAKAVVPIGDFFTMGPDDAIDRPTQSSSGRRQTTGKSQRRTGIIMPHIRDSFASI